jgi:hypothetical protein
MRSEHFILFIHVDTCHADARSVSVVCTEKPTEKFSPSITAIRFVKILAVMRY